MESDSAGLVILIVAAPILALILVFGTLANNGLIGGPSVNSIKEKITQTQKNTHNNIENDKQDF